MNRAMLTSRLYRHAKAKKALETRPQNHLNGNDAETLAASVLVKAMGGEVSWGSRNDDGRKIDLICSYDNPLAINMPERLILLVQVKSGNTYGTQLEKGFELKTEAKEKSFRATHPICIIWIDRTDGQSFWCYLHPGSKSKTQRYGLNHLVNPAMRFDIARCQAMFQTSTNHGSGVFIRALKGTVVQRRAIALKSYKQCKEGDVINPVIGKVELTRVGWRHMFRRTRHQRNKNSSLEAIPYLKLFLEQPPSELYTTVTKIETISEYEIRTSEYVLKFRKPTLCTGQQKKKVDVVIRLLEEIRWPKNWVENAMLSQLVERRVVLLSIYYK